MKLLFAALLLFPNWAIESLKWQQITHSLEKISFARSWKSVWTGVCIGNVSPGRSGEFAGRIIFFSPNVRAKAAALHFVSGLTQLAITIIMGCIGVTFTLNHLLPEMRVLFISVSLLSLAIVAYLLININSALNWIGKRKWLKRFNLKDLIIEPSLLRKLLFYSLIRYFIFSFQYYLLLLACNVHGPTIEILSEISVMYLLLSIIPMISFIEIGVRAFISVSLFNSFGAGEWELATSGILLWLLNIALPSMIGYLFLITNKISFSQTENDLA